MRLLILGGTGMLGHQLYKSLSHFHDVKITTRQSMAEVAAFKIFKERDVLANCNALNYEELTAALAEVQPEVIINAIGLIKQRPEKEDVYKNLEVNSLFPRQLSIIARPRKIRIVHFSTDCVFSGKRGHYTEADLCDAEDAYGKSKFLGELHESHTITLRTSIIGFELYNKASLLEWALSQKGQIRGFTKAIYTGFTTQEMARVVNRIITQFPDKSGLYQVASEPINKYELLQMINFAFKLNLDIVPDEKFTCYRDILSERFRREFTYQPPSWQVMIAELAAEYHAGRSKGSE